MSLDAFLHIVSDDEFDEIPVDLNTFLYDKDYMGLPPLSEHQVKLIEALSMVYKPETIEEIWPDDADKLLKTRFSEVIFQLGKGSGKDYTSTIAFCRIVYLLLCLRDPAAYYGKPSGDAIHLLNVAINATQAKNVFFKGFMARVKKCPWFVGKYNEKADHVDFEKNVTAHSGHSERESWEGYNLLVVILDEIAGFATEAETLGDNKVRGKTAEAIYNMYKASVSSRFPKWGKLALLSFPRFKGDFIQKRYDEVIADKVTSIRSHTFLIHDDLGDAEGNTFTVEWEEDRIVSYREPNVYALKRPTWEVNPLIDIEDLKSDFLRNMEDSLSRFACMPPDAIDAFFKDKQKIQNAFSTNRQSPFYDDWSFKEWFKPKDETEYYIHVDLGYTHDRCAVVMSHVHEWITVNYGAFKHHAPIIVVDAMRYWTPTPDKNVDFNEVENYILSLVRRRFNISLVTFDKWNSVGFRQRLTNDYDIKTELLSVAKPHYEDLSVAIAEDRVLGYHDDILVDELAGLKIIRGNKVDHPRKGSKDISDALAGSVYNTVANSRLEESKIVSVRFLTPKKPERDKQFGPERPAPSGPMPQDLSDFMRNMKIIGDD